MKVLKSMLRDAHQGREIPRGQAVSAPGVQDQ
jgi:hypothetical protein